MRRRTRSSSREDYSRYQPGNESASVEPDTSHGIVSTGMEARVRPTLSRLVAAWAKLQPDSLVVGGPANAAAWGVRKERAAIDRRIAFSVRLLLHGLKPMAVSADDPAVREVLAHERRRFRSLLEKALAEVDGPRGQGRGQDLVRGGSGRGRRR